MFAVVAINREDSAAVDVFGPYRSLAKAREIAASFRNVLAVDYRDSEEWEIYPCRMQSAE